MENITGQNNEFTLIFPHNRIDCTSSQNDKFNKIINQANHRKQQSYLNVFRH